MSWLKKKKKKRESRGELESEYAKLAKERERLQLKSELEERKREISRLKHPEAEKIRVGAKRTGGRIAKFTGEIIKEGARSYAKTRETLRRRRTRVRRITPKRSFVSPDGQDISLSQSIARADWDAGQNIMTREFFGSEMRQDKDFFGEKKADLIGSKKKKQNYF